MSNRHSLRTLQILYNACTPVVQQLAANAKSVISVSREPKPQQPVDTIANMLLGKEVSKVS